jgi:phenylalanyl-tRNA synthetase beta subunit
VTFDETVPLSGNSTYAALIASLRNIDPLLETIETVDLYEKDVNRTMTLRFTYRATDKTLTEEEVKKVHEKILAALKRV